jgi:hypothetical protein
MSIFGNIMSAIFGHGGQSGQAPPTPIPAGSTARAATTAAASGGQQPQPASGASNVDVEAVLTRLAAQKKEKLDWRRSIVDLMKLLGLDSSLSARKQGSGAPLHRRQQRFGSHEHLAAQAGHAKAVPK